ncbi:MAG: hypothetical protein IPL12_08450 [Bacteroidetes bacterium]|nr:hypothetical protein [Bacteroidota bacterium]
MMQVRIHFIARYFPVGVVPNGLGGIYKTTNRGASWTKINALDRVESITIDPNNANTMYATTESEGLWITNNLNVASPYLQKTRTIHFNILSV